MMRRWIGLAVSATALLPAIGPVTACNEVISWYADLKGASLTPAVASTASGKATFVFDFEHPRATVTLDTTGLKDVDRIELHACPRYSDLDGPTMVMLYQSKDGPLPSTLTKTITGTDVIKIDKPAVASIQDVAKVVVNDEAAVVVYTKAHTDGEIGGRIGMHKVYVYSDDPNSKFHDPALHRAHEAGSMPSGPASPTPPSTPSAPAK